MPDLTIAQAPMLCEPGNLQHLPTFFASEHHVLEQKIDGHRLLTELHPDAPPSFRSRTGEQYTWPIPPALQTLRGVGAYDGELLDGVYYVFDLPVLGVPLHFRRQVLEDQIPDLQGVRLVPQARTVDEKHDLFLRCLNERLEGVVVKRLDSLYRDGRRTTDWRKFKFVTTADLVVSHLRSDGKESADLAVMDHGVLRDIGRCSLLGKPPINEGDVVEVRYLYLGANGRLVQPTLLRRREDKRAEECTGDDLKAVNKTVLTSL